MTPNQLKELKRFDEQMKNGTIKLSMCFTNGNAVIAGIYFEHPEEVRACLKKYV